MNIRKIHLFKKFLLFVAGWLMFVSCSQNNKKEQPLFIATAANMQFAMEELVHQFSKTEGIPCELIVSSSGKLTAQIKEGAPYDVLVAANMKYPFEIKHLGFAFNEPKVYASGKLVLWTMDSDIELNIESLSKESIEHIALANPKTAPYGLAAYEALIRYGLLETLAPKLVYGESIAQTNQFITSQAVQVGFTAKSAVLSKSLKTKGKWVEVDKRVYKPIEQGIVVIKQSERERKTAIKFYNFMFSEEARQILTKFGYSTSEQN